MRLEHRNKAAAIVALICVLNLGLPATASANNLLNAQDAQDAITFTPLIGGELSTSVLPRYHDFTFFRYRLEPSAQIHLSPGIIATSEDGGEWEESDLVYVEHGAVDVIDASGATAGYERGGSFSVLGDSAQSLRSGVEVVNTGRLCVSLLRISASLATFSPQLAGGQEATHTPSIPNDPCKGEGSYEVWGGDLSTTMSPYLTRVEMESGAFWDFGSEVSAASIVIEEGILNATDRNGFELTYSIDDRISFFASDPHVVRNPDAATTTFLIFGMTPVPSGSAVIEVHTASCQSNVGTADYYGQCHENGDLDVPLSLHRGQDYVSHDSSIRTVTSALTKPGPGVVIFRGLTAGHYELVDSYPERSATGQIYVLCSDRSAGLQGDAPIVLEYGGSADSQIGLDVPEDGYIICDWYSNV